MLAEWDVEVGGRDHSVSIERSDNGKDSIRVDGRIVARPLTAEENERQISVGGAAYVMRRTGPSSFDLQFEPDASARAGDTASAVPAPTAAPATTQQGSGFHLPFAAWAFIVLVIGGGLFYAFGPSYEKQAKERVQIVLHEMQPGTGPETVNAVTVWAKGKKALDAGETSGATDSFDRWRHEKDLYRKLGDYEVIGASGVRNQKVPTAIVTFVLEGKEYKVRVPKDQPISWEE